MSELKVAKLIPLKCANENCELFGKEQTDYSIHFEKNPYVSLWVSKGNRNTAYGEVSCDAWAECQECSEVIGENNLSIDMTAELTWNEPA